MPIRITTATSTLLLIILSLVLPVVSAPTSAAVSTNGNLTATSNITQSHVKADCTGLGGYCEKLRDCCDCDIHCCCMTSLEDEGDPFANNEGYCCWGRAC